MSGLHLGTCSFTRLRCVHKPVTIIPPSVRCAYTEQCKSSLKGLAEVCPQGLSLQPLVSSGSTLGGILALRAHYVLLLDYVPPEEPRGTPLGNTLRIRQPKLDWGDLEGHLPGLRGSGEGLGAFGAELDNVLGGGDGRH